MTTVPYARGRFNNTIYSKTYGIRVGDESRNAEVRTPSFSTTENKTSPTTEPALTFLCVMSRRKGYSLLKERTDVLGARRGPDVEGFEKTPRRGRYLVDRRIEGFLVRLRWLSVTAHLAYVLQRRGLDLVDVGDSVRSSQHLDAPTHDSTSILSGHRPPMVISATSVVAPP
jgi:hypothetical protein